MVSMPCLVTLPTTLNPDSYSWAVLLEELADWAYCDWLLFFMCLATNLLRVKVEEVFEGEGDICLDEDIYEALDRVFLRV